MTTIEAVRKQAPHYLSDEVARTCGLTLAQLQQLIGGTFQPTDEQLRCLAKRMHMEG